MPSLKPAAAEGPEQYLWLALRAPDAKRRVRLAQKGLRGVEEGPLDPDTELLLLRQLYLGHIELDDLAAAADVALQMTAVGPLRDVAYHDLARVLFALDRSDRAIEAQRLSARAAPPERRSFQLWCLATLQHFSGHPESALSTLRRALRWAVKDRSLIRAHTAYIQLDAGRPAPGLAEVVAELGDSPSREGYGQFLLGALAELMGDTRLAAVHYRAFLNRNASADPTKVITLREELRRARTALGRLESV